MKRASEQYTTQLLPKWRKKDNHRLIRTLTGVLTILMQGIIIVGCNSKQSSEQNKEVFIPQKIWMVSDSMNYDDSASEYCFERMLETENFVMFWHKEYGANPASNSDSTKWFDPKACMSEMERHFNHYFNELKFYAHKDELLIERYKILVFVFYNPEIGSAFGGDAEETVGVLWTPSLRINKYPYGTLGHELAHVFQTLLRIDNEGNAMTGGVNEMSAQYMMWQVYPKWMTFENFHLKSLMRKTHLAFLHNDNIYHDPYLLEYWAQIRGKEFHGELSRSTQKGEDVVMTYKRINNISQSQFNDEVFDASRRFITWDLERVKDIAKIHANQHFTTMLAEPDGWFRIDSTKCPQNYGYNGIKLEVPEAGTTVSLSFQGIADDERYTRVNSDKAGWRYGFVASLEDGSRVYSNMGSEIQGELKFEVPDKTVFLWLVVSGAPNEHWKIPEASSCKEPLAMEQWAYKIRFDGTLLDPEII